MRTAKIRMRWQVIVVLAICAIVTFPFDVTFAWFFHNDPFPGELRGLIHKTEFFGHAYGILGITFTAYLLDEHNRRRLVRIVCSALLAGLTCDVIKTFIHRIRPVDYSFVDGGPTFLGISFLHVNSWSEVFDSQFHSFPSAHTATAVGFALALGNLYPKGRLWFLALASWVAMGRFDGGAHYVSDTFVGGMVGYVVACWVLGDSWLGRRFSRFESRVPRGDQNTKVDRPLGTNFRERDAA